PSPAAQAASPVSMTSGFFADPDSVPAIWVKAHPADSRAGKIQASIGSKPIAKWFGATSGTIGTAVGAFVGRAENADKLPVLVAYNLPGRDACGGQSGGGAGSPAAYRTWIAAFASGIGTRPAIVVIEPDALGDFACMDSAAIATRNGLLTFAAQQFRDRAVNTWAYLDAGNANWVPAATMADRLNAAGVANIHGFVVNVSNFYTTAQSVSYSNAVNQGLSSHGYTRPFAVDTSRNGNGSNGQWCNPAGRRLGVTAQLGGGAEMLLWVKTPGSSDGLCGTAPTIPAGTFSPDLAVRLIDGT
ncbi:MAG: endoglucanase, partial [Cryptosporangiaceae bacterium]|nr:endoglucanase [Cryptosporangiaceae bacterium]